MATASSITPHFDSNKSQARTAQWVQGAANTKTALILSEGCSSLFHPDHYQFREYSPIGSVYVRKYLYIYLNGLAISQIKIEYS